MDNRETEHAYPRITDPASDDELTISNGATGNNYLTADTFVVPMPTFDVVLIPALFCCQ